MQPNEGPSGSVMGIIHGEESPPTAEVPAGHERKGIMRSLARYAGLLMLGELIDVARSAFGKRKRA